MAREEIVRSDFPTSRRGYDRGAVDAHLRDLAGRMAELEEQSRRPSLASTAGDRVASIVEAAEAEAAEIGKEAKARAEQVRRDAQAEAERMTREARQEAERFTQDARESSRRQIERAAAAVAGLAEEVEGLRARAQALGPELTDRPSGEISPGPVTAPEPTVPGPEIDPSPTIVPEPSPEPVPEPTPEPVPEPSPPEPEPGDPEPAAEELSADVSEAEANGGPEAGSGSDEDEAGARLVALKMALDGASRDEVAQHLTEDFQLSDSSQMIDDVFARAGR